ncbi:S-methyl-5-thioribose-1-phosphate isomerase [Adlercreutzia sp. R25]|uniref:S-methyl-5-thioribose-1-phosphate isomerase n=1 Tax=Adlercreutzia shanghongiae TaxID=3111773 RepID=UPI002DBADAF8|nr:S-methyl-5-thioribose-1-phosphate isomerase [Adlercreutzia sp. R25]MEC4272279.1 S-methyl-5-thioribose-1-phosphate isomerase [Adlercreutzia sp. R25]
MPSIVLVDQCRLPGELVYLRTSDWRELVDAVKTLAVRGAPAIGVAGAAAVMLAAFEYADGDGFDRLLAEAARAIAAARPTAVNLVWGVNKAREVVSEARQAGASLQADSNARQAGASPRETAVALYRLTEDLIAEDETVNRRIGSHGAALLRGLAASGEHVRPLNILTHCNAGSLATAFYGTALGVVYASAQEGLVNRVYADETRPVNQGARLTVWELAQAGVPVTLQCDNMAASLMEKGQVDAVIVGADRIAANGDAANKIGTLGLAVLANFYGIPFYVAAPMSTIDCSTKSGADIPIEDRDRAEVLPDPIPGVEVRNPAFDVTPYRLITAIVTEEGVWEPAR